jgi:small subunit ribosomal protein S18
MAFGRGRGSRAAANKKQNRYRRVRRKVCTFCAERTDDIDYKMHQRLRRFVSDRGKIIPRRTTGTCAGHQRLLAHAIKRAREVALLPFTAE